MEKLGDCREMIYWMFVVAGGILLVPVLCMVFWAVVFVFWAAFCSVFEFCRSGR